MSRERRVARIAAAVPFLGALLVALVAPATAAASTGRDPSLPPCDLSTATVLAGTPLVLTGTTTGGSGAVGIMARSTVGTSREGAVTIADGHWRAVLVFGAEDWGSWTIDVAADGGDCVSVVTVTLPPGVLAPRQAGPVPGGLATAPDELTSSELLTAATWGLAALVLVSYVVLLAVGIAAAFGIRPLRSRAIRVALRLAAFLAVLGTMVGAASVVALSVSMAHFDTGLSPVESAVIDAVSWLAVGFGSVLGALAARRVPGDPARLVHAPDMR